jgi:hypothetical protein
MLALKSWAFGSSKVSRARIRTCHRSSAFHTRISVPGEDTEGKPLAMLHDRVSPADGSGGADGSGPAHGSDDAATGGAGPATVIPGAGVVVGGCLQPRAISREKVKRPGNGRVIACQA